MAELAYTMQYEDMAPHKLKIRKGPKMSKEQTPAIEAPTVKSYTKTRGEHFKDIIIAILVVGVIAFVGGMQFQSNHQAEIKAAVLSAQAETPVKK